MARSTTLAWWPRTSSNAVGTAMIEREIGDEQRPALPVGRDAGADALLLRAKPVVAHVNPVKTRSMAGQCHSAALRDSRLVPAAPHGDHANVGHVYDVTRVPDGHLRHQSFKQRHRSGRDQGRNDTRVIQPLVFQIGAPGAILRAPDPLLFDAPIVVSRASRLASGQCASRACRSARGVASSRRLRPCRSPRSWRREDFRRPYADLGRGAADRQAVDPERRLADARRARSGRSCRRCRCRCRASCRCRSWRPGSWRPARCRSGSRP